jgi:hypothetical protein
MVFSVSDSYVGVARPPAAGLERETRNDGITFVRSRHENPAPSEGRAVEVNIPESLKHDGGWRTPRNSLLNRR